jgi:N-methylhydantoinase A/oxoprolinase/acetone carboxylase beta subunit
VKAFAVAGYAGHVNPTHELEVKRIIQEETGLSVTCGHDVSEGLNYRVRAETAALNARIIPYLESLFQKVKASLRGRGIDAPVMVVKSDGSLTSIQTATERPIETVLSGPAASVAGVKHLTKQTNSIVMDIGGTTSDTAIIREGVVRTCNEGAVVGGWQTHVNALDMRTMGLGGDSLISWEKGNFSIGPKRVAPISWLVSQQPTGIDAVDWIEHHLNANEMSSRGLEIIALNGYDEKRSFEGREARIIEILHEAPRSLQELAQQVDCLAWQLLPIDRLEAAHIVQRSGLTPTDVLHTVGRIGMWNTEAAERMCGVFSRLLHMNIEEFTEEVIRRMHRLLAEEILKKHLDSSVGVSVIENSPVARVLIDSAFQSGVEGLDVEMTLEDPVVGIGAPAHLFLPEAARLLHTKAVIPVNADVANAIGAITSSVYVHKQVTISIDEGGTYHLKGLPDTPTFESLAKAQDFAVEQLKKTVREMALKAGTSQTRIEIIGNDNIGTVADGSGVFLGRTLEARLTGRPDIERLVSKI